MVIRDVEKNKGNMVVGPHVHVCLWNLETPIWLMFLGNIELQKNKVLENLFRLVLLCSAALRYS